MLHHSIFNLNDNELISAEAVLNDYKIITKILLNFIFIRTFLLTEKIRIKK